MTNFATKNTDTTNTRLGVLRAQLETLEDDVKSVAGDVGGIADLGVHEVLRKAEVVAHNAYQFAEDTIKEAGRDVDEWAQSGVATARKSIRNRPLLALVLSAGAGALIGALVGRR
jgi:ElaB/YqjD/DUF883 family membrane-anchored ribosome-binding protein